MLGIYVYGIGSASSPSISLLSEQVGKVHITVSLFSKLFGEERELKKLRHAVTEINAHEPEVEKLSSQELLLASKKLRQAIQKSEATFDEALAKAFAFVREAAQRTLGQRHYDVQLMGGIVLHRNGIAEMKTGEGKTLASTAPIYLNALEGKGVHVITVNDFLARRDAVWMGQIYHSLGLSVACLTHDSAYLYDPSYVVEKKPLGTEAEEKSDKDRDITGAFRVHHEFLRPITKREAYNADITYGTNHEFGFDYLRDNMAYSFGQQVQRGHHFAVIDEVDSILIDEARTPLIIAAPDTQSSELYKTFARIARQLKRDEDYEVDEKFHAVSITDTGIEKVEKMLSLDNIYDPENFKLVHYLEESLRAEALFKKDKDYVVKNGEVIIVDAFTGRLMHGRRYSGGLHQAIEAKEGALIREETKTVASITIQNYFRMYKKLAGMTGTAQTSAEEFHKVYNLDVVSIPPNKPSIRKDFPDAVYKTEKGKYEALVKEISERHKKGQPILIGTVAIEKNEVVSSYLAREGIKHEVLNAKNHEREGEITAQAGRIGAVTVATNMAGRGVDIILGGNPPNLEGAQKVKDLGGLHIVGTERHDSRRIDNQLRGRAGRQGDPGSSMFFLSLEDDLMRVFGGDKLQRLMNTFKIPEDMPIESGLVSKAIEGAQAKVEGFNFDTRKHTLEYDDVINRQRHGVYDRRRRILEAEEDKVVMELAREYITNQIARMAMMPVEDITKALVQVGVIEKAEDFALEAEGEQENKERVTEYLQQLCIKRFEEKMIPEKTQYLKILMLQIIDHLWMNHLENVDALRDSVRMRAYAQHDPLVEFKREGYRLFKDLFAQLEAMFFSAVFKFTVTPSIRNTTLQHELAGKIKEVHAGYAGAKSSEQKMSGGKIGRNNPCPCGSGKKYKKCHGA